MQHSGGRVFRAGEILGTEPVDAPVVREQQGLDMPEGNK